MRTICRTFICTKTIGGVSMPKQSKAQPNRAADRAKNTFEFYEHAGLGLNAKNVPDALAGYWTRVLARVRELSESVLAKETPEDKKHGALIQCGNESKMLFVANSRLKA